MGKFADILEKYWSILFGHEETDDNPEETAGVSYVFLDVVDFSKRSVEAQTDIVKGLNKIVKRSVGAFDISRSDVIYLPTGDGICICLLELRQRIEIPVRLAAEILRRIHEHNLTEVAGDVTRHFQVRIGVNENNDHIVTDVNRRKNLAGAGINMAQRVMSLADGNQILVSQVVQDKLQPRKQFENAFREFEGVIKHGKKIRVFQFLGWTGLEGKESWLNTETPHSLASTSGNANSSSDESDRIFIQPEYDIRGLWRYTCLSMEGDLQHGGSCEIKLVTNRLKNIEFQIFGERRWHGKTLSDGKVVAETLRASLGWQSLWSVIQDDRWFRFGYIVQTANHNVIGMGEFQLPKGSEPPSVCVGTYYQLPPTDPRRGRIRLDRIKTAEEANQPVEADRTTV